MLFRDSKPMQEALGSIPAPVGRVRLDDCKSGLSWAESEALSPKGGVMFERRHLDMKLFLLKTSHTQTCIYTPMHVHPHIYTHALRVDKLVCG